MIKFIVALWRRFYLYLTTRPCADCKVQTPKRILQPWWVFGPEVCATCTDKRWKRHWAVEAELAHDREVENQRRIARAKQQVERELAEEKLPYSSRSTIRESYKYSGRFERGDIADTSLWDAIDATRRKTRGWEDINTIRIRRADNVLSDHDFTIIEVLVKKAEVIDVRVLQRGVYPHAVAKHPILFYRLEKFVQWFNNDQQQEGIIIFWQLWHRDQWVGHQAALMQIHEVFRE